MIIARGVSFCLKHASHQNEVLFPIPKFALGAEKLCETMLGFVKQRT